MSDLPLIDISPLATDGEVVATIDEIESACRDVGFMYITGHGIPDEVMASVRTAVIEYFNRPVEQKLRGRIRKDNYRGYIPRGFFTANRGGTQADEYEGFKLHQEVDADDPIRKECKLYGPNLWPAGSTGLRDAVSEYWQHCDRIADTLLRALGRSFEIGEDAFLRYFEQPLTNMTLLHYPPHDATGIGIHPHKDTDALTIVAPDPAGGLSVRKRDDSGWIEVAPPEGALVLNIGDMLEIWSGGYFVSTPHMVVNTTGQERYSFPYFAVPRHDVLVKPVRKPQPGFDRPDLPVGKVSRDIWYSNWPDADPVDDRFDPATP